MNAAKNRYWIVLIIVVIILLSSCATTSLHSPRPNKPGEVSLGIHAGYILGTGSAETSGLPLILNATGRVGLFDQAELGINAGTLGGNVAFKYGLFSHESPFQFSILGGLGLALWQFFDLDAGIIVGYSIADIVMPYAGFRQHVLLATGALPYGNVVGGIQIDTGSIVSFMLEFDYSFYYTNADSTSTGGSLSVDPSSVSLPVINAGINLTF